MQKADISRGDFLKGAAAFTLGGWQVMVAPPGWKSPRTPKLVFGVLADTHLRISRTGGYDAKNWPNTYLVAALRHFRNANVDAVVHCGDMADRGVVEEMQFHADAWRTAFPDGCAADGRKVEKLFVNGNHAVQGDEPDGTLYKSVYAAGCNMGIVCAPDKRVTILKIPVSELPSGKTLAITVRPLTSLGTYGRAIAAEFQA